MIPLISDSQPSYAGPLICLLLAFQTSAHGILRSTIPRHGCNDGILLITEMVKGAFSLGMAIFLEDPASVWCLDGWFKVLPIGVLYAVMNAISMACTPHVSATLFSVIMQLKLVFTYVLTLLCRRRSTTLSKCLTICNITLATIGVIWVTSTTLDDTYEMWAVAGLVFETFLSGLATLYMQSLLTDKIQDVLWSRNVQLALVGSVIFTFRGYTSCSDTAWLPNAAEWWIVFTGSVGGVLVALALIFAGGVEKCIATCTSVVLTVLGEVLFFHRETHPLQLIMCLIVVLCVAQYHAA